MHEMSIAHNIIEIVSRESDKAGSARIREVELEIGRLSGVEYDALDFAFKIMAPGTILEGCTVIIQKPEGRMVCTECGEEFITNSLITGCPVCKSFACDISGGRELRVKSILIE